MAKKSVGAPCCGAGCACFNVEWGKVLLAAVAFTIIAQVVHTVEAMLTMNYYQDPAFFGVWSKVMMPGAGAPPTEFFVYSIAFGFVTALIFAFFYANARSILCGSGWRKGVCFGLWLFFLVGVTGTLAMYLLLNVPSGLLLSWLASGLVIYVAGGVAIAAVVK